MSLALSATYSRRRRSKAIGPLIEQDAQNERWESSGGNIPIPAVRRKEQIWKLERCGQTAHFGNGRRKETRDARSHSIPADMAGRMCAEDAAGQLVACTASGKPVAGFVGRVRIRREGQTSPMH